MVRRAAVGAESQTAGSVMEWLLVALVAGAILGFAATSLRRLRDDEHAHRPAAPSSVPAPVAAPPPAPRPLQQESLQELGQMLAPAYESSSHPQDLESHPAFQRGVACLCDPDVPLEHVVNYCVGANAHLAAM